MLREAKEEQRKLESLKQQLDGSIVDTKCILGKYFQRRTRFREPILPMKLLRDGLFTIYGKLRCLDMKVCYGVSPHTIISGRSRGVSKVSIETPF